MRKDHDTTWYVVADATRARIIKLEAGPVRSPDRVERKIVPALNLEFAGRDLKSRDVLADRLGQRAPAHPAAPADPQDDAKAVFALDLANVLDKALNEHRFDRLILTAPPEMLGKIRNALTEQVKHRILHANDKDLTQLPDNELAERLTRLTEDAA